MKLLIKALPFYIYLLLIALLPGSANSETALAIEAQTSTFQEKVTSSFQEDAQLIRATYESRLFTLPAYQAGHYGLRMFRQTLDRRYAATVWSDMARIASQLNRFASEIYTPQQIQDYADRRLENYQNKSSSRSQLRYQATKQMPQYLYLGVALLSSMARANEYGLKHREDAKLRRVIRRYDFSKYATNKAMIKAWAAQLANQVYWLRQLGEQDVVDEFIHAFRKTYPDNRDYQLSPQQFSNKIYGLTHIIFAASAYYQYAIREQDFQWLFDYYRNNIDAIIVRTKEDVIAEVGINFLLAGLADDPVVMKTRKVIQLAISREYGLIPSVTGNIDLSSGEHRNVLAIMLLDWKGTHAVPTALSHPEMFTALPYGLVVR